MTYRYREQRKQQCWECQQRDWKGMRTTWCTVRRLELARAVEIINVQPVDAAI